jgi:hypothetical protein
MRSMTKFCKDTRNGTTLLPRLVERHPGQSYEGDCDEIWNGTEIAALTAVPICE